MTKTEEKTMEWKMKHNGMTYLNKEIRKQRKELDNRLRQKSIEPLTHARACDMLRWFQKRIEVAKLVDKDALASSQDSFRRKVEGLIGEDIDIKTTYNTYPQTVIAINDFKAELRAKLKTLNK